MIPVVISAAHVAAHQPPTVSVPSVCPHAFRVVRLGGTTRWFRERGYVVPILSGDRAFDERWAVEADDHEFAEALVRDREARGAIARLDELGFGALAHSRRKLHATLTGKEAPPAEREARKAEVRAQLEALDGLITRLCRHRTFPHHGGRAPVVVATVLLCVSLAAGLAGLAVGSDQLLRGELGPLALKSLAASLPLVAVVCFALARLLAGRSRSHRDLGLVVFLSLLALPALGLAGAVTLNNLADPGPATVRTLPVLEVQRHRGEGDDVSHYAVVPEWREGEDRTRRIRLSRALADRTVAGQSRLRITTSPGRLGGERLLDLRLEGETAAR